MYRSLYTLLARADAERVHDWTLHGLAWLGRRPLLLGLLRRRLAVADARLAVRVFGLAFPNPLGVAAGLDKNGVAVRALGSFGWGHVEIGTATPLPQAGNPKPRVFRLTADAALINRMGFPGGGMAAVQHNLQQMRGPRPLLGINIGANKTQVEAGLAAQDYVAALQTLAPWADYLAINVSSPNTARLRALQGAAALDALLAEIVAARAGLARRVPVLVKIAPDLTPAELDALLEVVLRHGIDGLIATNTTLARPASLQSPYKTEVGGLSGRPLRERSTAMIRTIHQATNGTLPLIGVGGVFDAADVWEKLRAGATLVQLYTGFVYGGPLVAWRINQVLLARLRAEGCRSIGEIVGG